MSSVTSVRYRHISDGRSLGSVGHPRVGHVGCKPTLITTTKRRSNEMALQIVEALPGLEVGKGFDALTNDVKVTTAVLGNVGTPEGAAGQEGSFDFTMVKGSSEFREALGISASISAGVGLFGASAKAKYAERCEVSTQSTVCILSFEARNAFVTFKDTPKLDPSLEELLKLNKTQRFRERGGTNFVGGMWAGVAFYGTIRIESGDELKDQ